MKTTKKILSVLLAVLMMSFCMAAFAGAEDATVLKFNEDGKFKIMTFADIQDNEEIEETTIQFMCEALDTYKPDLVVFLGDNTVAKGYDNQYTAIEAITAPVRDRDIPYGIVFGNHDQEQGVDKEDLLEIYRSFGCLTYDAVPEMYGCGTCNLPILSSDGSKVAFNVWLTDSGSKNLDPGVGGYDYVHPDQIEWYKSTASALKAANGGKVVPSMNFQHIVVPEIYKAVYIPLPFGLGEATPTVDGVSYAYIPRFGGYNGMILEPPCPPNVADGQYDAWLEMGDVMATFTGHDHTNSFEIEYKGIMNINVPTAGCSSYSNEMTRGAGLITLDENDISNYSYELVHLYDVALAKDSKISEVNGGKSKFAYTFYKIMHELITKIHDIINTLNVK